MTYSATVKTHNSFDDDTILTGLEDTSVIYDDRGNLIWIGDNFVIAQSSFVSVTFTEDTPPITTPIGFAASLHSGNCRCGKTLHS